MPRQILKVKGWTSIRKGPLDCWQCPECNGLSEPETVLFSDEGVRCFHCDKNFAESAFGRAAKETTFATCAECLVESALGPACEGIVGYLCACDNYLAIPFEDQIFQPDEIMAVQWNTGIQDRALFLSDTCAVIKCETDKDWQVLAVMQVPAKEFNPEFKFARKEDNEALLSFDLTTGRYIGYLLWYEKKEYAILNQLYVIAEQRRKGYAEAMVTHWIETHAKQISEKFALESPNEQATALHIKLGHIRREGDDLIGVGGCTFMSGV